MIIMRIVHISPILNIHIIFTKCKKMNQKKKTIILMKERQLKRKPLRQQSLTMLNMILGNCLTIVNMQKRSGVNKEQDKEYLQIWDGFITRHQKGRSLIHNTVYIKNRTLLEDKVFPIVRNILQNYSRQEKFTITTTFSKRMAKFGLQMEKLILLWA